MPKLRIIFMGSAQFAVPSLQLLLEQNFDVVAVVTAPDKPMGRGMKLGQSPIKEIAINRKIPLLQPSNLKAEEFLAELKSYNANLQVVVAFRMLPHAVWSMPLFGTFNLHASLLPQYRGSAPINWAIINGENETGVTTFFIEREIDTGHIIFQEALTISDLDDAGSLYEKLMDLGSKLVLKTVRAIESGDCSSTPQPVSSHIKPAPKIFRETCKIDWNQTSERIKNFVRGLSPYPCAWTEIDGKTYKIFRIQILEPRNATMKSGNWKTDNKTYLYFYSNESVISILELQPEGKRRMKIEDFFRGNKIDK